MAHKKWIVAQADKEKASVLSEKFNIDPFLSFLLVSRGFNDELKMDTFLRWSNSFCSPFGFADMDKAVNRINKALDSGEKICVYGDYDCDGVTATALLFSFLQTVGGDVFYYIPSRENEGYGMNKDAIDKIIQQGAKLIVTVDNGISAIDEAEYIYSKGADLVVTDHHQIGNKLPRAEAVVNPHRTDNKISFCDFAGVGVAFKLVCALFDGDPDEMMLMYSDLVTIGTIGDIVPLLSENRALVRDGLHMMNQAPRLGVSALMKAAGHEGELMAQDVAFKLCPRINAAGRLDSAIKALKLLLSENEDDAKLRAEQLCIENQHRKELEKNILDDIEEKISKDSSLVGDRVIVVAEKGYHPGVIGIVASHIVERYGKPAIIITIFDDGTASGSARSIEGFDIYDAISNCQSDLTRFGGHPMAAGIGLAESNIEEFRKNINLFAYQCYEHMPYSVLNIDCKLSPAYLSLDLVKNISFLEPCGAENGHAVFGLFGLKLLSVTPLSEGRHIRIEVQKKGKTVKIVQFGVSAEKFPYIIGDLIDCAVEISNNVFKDKNYLSVRAVDIRRSSIDDDLFFQQKDDYENFLAGKPNLYSVYPDREKCSLVYRFIKSRGGWNCSFDDLYFALGQKVTYAQLKFALEAFNEAGLIEYSQIIALKEVIGKTDLTKTATLMALKGRMSIEQ